MCLATKKNFADCVLQKHGLNIFLCIQVIIVTAKLLKQFKKKSFQLYHSFFFLEKKQFIIDMSKLALFIHDKDKAILFLKEPQGSFLVLAGFKKLAKTKAML